MSMTKRDSVVTGHHCYHKTPLHSITNHLNFLAHRNHSLRLVAAIYFFRLLLKSHFEISTKMNEFWEWTQPRPYCVPIYTEYAELYLLHALASYYVDIKCSKVIIAKKKCYNNSASSKSLTHTVVQIKKNAELAVMMDNKRKSCFF